MSEDRPDDNQIETRPVETLYTAQLNSFHRPRTSNFSKSFIGRRFADTSLNSATRMIERAKKHEKEIADRLKQKEEWERNRLEQAQKMNLRRKQRRIALERKLWEEKQKLKALEIQRQENIAAVRVQAAGRGFMSRKRVRGIQRQRLEQHSAVRIQCQVRQRHASIRVSRKRQELRDAELSRSATGVQRIYRGHAARKEYEKVRREALELRLVAEKLDSDLQNVLPIVVSKTEVSPEKKQPSPEKIKVAKSQMVYKRVGGGYMRQEVSLTETTVPVRPMSRPTKPTPNRKNRPIASMSSVQAQDILTGTQWSGNDNDLLQQWFKDETAAQDSEKKEIVMIDLPPPTKPNTFDRPTTRRNESVVKKKTRRPVSKAKKQRGRKTKRIPALKSKTSRAEKVKQTHTGDFPELKDMNTAVGSVVLDCSADLAAVLDESSGLDYEKVIDLGDEDSESSDHNPYDSDGFESED